METSQKIIWQYHHYEQNDDYPQNNDCGNWMAYEAEGMYFISCTTDEGKTFASQVEGDIKAAKDKFPSETEWPSAWLGPQDIKDTNNWDNVLKHLDLTRVGELWQRNIFSGGSGWSCMVQPDKEANDGN